MAADMLFAAILFLGGMMVFAYVPKVPAQGCLDLDTFINLVKKDADKKDTATKLFLANIDGGFMRFQTIRIDQGSSSAEASYFNESKCLLRIRGYSVFEMPFSEGLKKIIEGAELVYSREKGTAS